MPKQELLIPGPEGQLEALYYSTEEAVANSLALICHPDPRHEGSMHNKVVTTIARACNKLQIPALTFNYRGVGQSQGSFGDIVGEVADGRAVLSYALSNLVQGQVTKLYLAGFSFGSYIAAKLGSEYAATMLITVAPSIERMPYAQLDPVNCPWLVIQGEQDEVVSPESVYAWFDNLQAEKELVRMPMAGHFFHGKLIDLESVLMQRLPQFT